MGPAAKAISPSMNGVQAALLDYFQAPGKYQLACRQPEVLFNAVREVLQVATGRVEGLDGRQPKELRDAAAFFVGAALLYPGADHYALLGVARSTNGTELKERYRMLMRLVHPDFAGTSRPNWPNDSAMRVNRAYEVLSSPVLRREYDEQFASGTVQHRGPSQQTARRAIPGAKHSAPGIRGRFAKRAAWAFVLVLSLTAVAMLLPHPAPVRIVQKPGPAANAKTKISVTPIPGRSALESEHQPAPQLAQVESGPATQSPIPPTGAPFVAAAPAVPSRASPPDGTGEGPNTIRATVPVEPAPPRPEAMDSSSSQRVTLVPAFPAMGIRPSPSVPSPSEFNPGESGTTQPVAMRPLSVPTLSEVQPLLTRLLQELESGNTERVLNLLEPEARRTAGAQIFSRQYQRIVRSSGAVTLSHVEFKSETHHDVLVVMGDMRLSGGQSTVGSLGEKLLLRAEFASRGGRVTLTRLSGGSE
jgi:hypothetical protein